VAHGVVALVIVVLVPWKTMIVSRGMRRARAGRSLSVGLTVFTLASLATGLVLITGTVDFLGPFTTMQVHVAAGLGTVSLTLVHTLHRPVPHRRTDLNRRNLLRAGSLTVAGGAVWLATEGVIDLWGVRGGERRFTGSHEIIAPEDVPATQWINDRVQHLDVETHRVDVVGVNWSVAEISAAGDTVEATLDCTGGWFTTQTWNGTRLDRLLDAHSGRSIVVCSTTGYWRRFPLQEASELVLATHMGGEPLRDGNGGPVRLVAPGRRGYWWVKWVDRIEVDDQPPWWQPPLPTA